MAMDKKTLNRMVEKIKLQNKPGLAGLILGLWIAAFPVSAQNYNWAYPLGSSASSEICRDVAVDPNGNVHVAGTFQNVIDLNFDTPVYSQTPVGGTDVYVACYSPSSMHLWSFKIGSAGYEDIAGVATDANSSTYVTGTLVGTADFDPASGVYNLTPQSTQDIFLAKYDVNGLLQWAINIGDVSGYCAAGDVSTDAAGNVIITGQFDGTTNFNPLGTPIYLTPDFSGDIFVAKYNASGICQWAFAIASPGTDFGRAVCTDPSGNVIITGMFNGTADFDPGVGTNLLSALPGNFDMYLAKYDAAGNYLWAHSFGDALSDMGNGVAADASGNVFLCGDFYGTVDFDPGSGVANETSAGYIDGFLSKYDPAGNHLWSFNLGSTGVENISDVEISPAGNVHITGQFSGTVDFNPYQGASNLTSNGNEDIFLAAYTNAGAHIWSFNTGSAATEKGTAIALSGSGYLYATGFLAMPADFDPLSGTATVTPGAMDGYLAQYEACSAPVLSAISGSPIPCANGTATFSASAPWTYSYSWSLPPGWSGSSSTSSITVNTTTSGGTISVTATNACGTSAPQAMLLSMAAPITTSPGSGVNVVSCYGTCDGQVTINTSGGTPPYTYSPSTTNLCAGTHTFTITDNAGCTATATATVASPPQLFLSVNNVSPVCSGTNITLTATVSGGSPGYSYLWTPGNLTTPSITTAPASTTTYICTVTDAAGCTQAFYRTVIVHTPLGQIGPISGPQTVCSGNPYSYSIPFSPNISSCTWTLPPGWSGSSTGSIIFPTAGGLGNIIVTANNSCGSSIPDTLPIASNYLALTLTPVSPTCNSLCNGSLIPSISSSSSFMFPPPTYSYSMQLNNLCAGTYTVTVTESSTGCTDTDTTTILQPAAITASATTAQPSVCTGSCTNLNVNASGGTAPLSYLWMPGSMIVTSPNVCPAAATTYTCTVTDANNCTQNTTVTVYVDPFPANATAISGAGTVCQNQPGVMYSVASIANTTGYNWILPAGASIVAGANTNSITVDFSASAVSGNITVEGTNACGAGVSASLPVTVNPLPDSALAITGLQNIIICPQATGITFSVPAIGNAAYYVWSLPAGASVTAGDSTNTITVDFAVNASSGPVTVYAENACGTGAPASLAVSIDLVSAQNVCMVTVNAVSTYNNIVWEKPVTTSIDSFRIYREITSSFVHIGSVHYDSMSTYVDSVFLPLANPNTTNHRYKISAVDSCGNESVLSQHHRTLFLQSNVGIGNTVNLSWNLYEGAAVNFYRVLRDSTNLGNWEVIDSVPGSNTVYTDLNPPLSVSVTNIRYKLQTNWATSCSPSRAINTSESNLKDVPTQTFSIAENNPGAWVSIFPNPSQGSVSIAFPGSMRGGTITVRDIAGRIVHSEILLAKNGAGNNFVQLLDLSKLAKGTYTLALESGKQIIHKKLILQ